MRSRHEAAIDLLTTDVNIDCQANFTSARTLVHSPFSHLNDLSKYMYMYISIYSSILLASVCVNSFNASDKCLGYLFTYLH